MTRRPHFHQILFWLGDMFKRFYPSNSILQMVTSEMLVRDPKQRLTIFYVLTLHREMVISSIE